MRVKKNAKKRKATYSWQGEDEIFHSMQKCILAGRGIEAQSPVRGDL